MKKILSTILILFIIIMIILVGMLYKVRQEDYEIQRFNDEILEYTQKDLIYGADVATLINKAIDNNKKYNVQKDEKGLYIQDENSIQIEVKFYILEENIKMETIASMGIESFMENYNIYEFKCSTLEYNPNTKKINKIIFEEIPEDQ